MMMSCPFQAYSPPTGSLGVREPCVLGCTSLVWSFSLTDLEEGGREREQVLVQILQTLTVLTEF